MDLYLDTRISCWRFILVSVRAPWLRVCMCDYVTPLSDNVDDDESRRKPEWQYPNISVRTTIERPFLWVSPSIPPPLPFLPPIFNAKRQICYNWIRTSTGARWYHRFESGGWAISSRAEQARNFYRHHAKFGQWVGAIEKSSAWRVLGDLPIMDARMIPHDLFPRVGKIGI